MGFQITTFHSFFFGDPLQSPCNCNYHLVLLTVLLAVSVAGMGVVLVPLTLSTSVPVAFLYAPALNWTKSTTMMTLFFSSTKTQISPQPMKGYKLIHTDFLFVNFVKFACMSLCLCLLRATACKDLYEN